MNKTVRGIIAVIILLILTFVLLGNPMILIHNRQLEKTILSAGGEGTVTLEELVPFDWDAAYCFGPYTEKSEIEQAIGVKSGSIGRSVSEGMLQLVFVNDGVVTASLTCDPGKSGYYVSFDGMISCGSRTPLHVSYEGGTVVMTMEE